MEFLFSIIWLFSTLAIIAGLIRPSVVIRWGIKRTRKKVLLIYGIAWFSSLIIFGIIAPSEEERNMAKTIADFKKNRLEIIENAEIAFIEKRYKDLISETQEFIVVDDSTLNRLRIAARIEMKRQSDAARSEEILTELKNIPAHDYERNMVLYKELSELSPDNSIYKEKYDYYCDMNNQEQARLEAKRNSVRSDEILNELKNVPEDNYAWKLDLYAELVSLSPNNPEYKKKRDLYQKKYDDRIEQGRNSADKHLSSQTKVKVSDNIDIQNTILKLSAADDNISKHNWERGDLADGTERWLGYSGEYIIYEVTPYYITSMSGVGDSPVLAAQAILSMTYINEVVFPEDYKIANEKVMDLIEQISEDEEQKKTLNFKSYKLEGIKFTTIGMISYTVRKN